jgi:uncharacterized membrane protein
MVHQQPRRDFNFVGHGNFSCSVRRKHYTSQNMLDVVDFGLKFTYVLDGWKWSTHDASILADSLARDDGINILDGKF